MFQTIHENIHRIGCALAILVIVHILLFFLIGIIVKKRGVFLDTLLIGEEYLFAATSSIVIFLIFSLPVALVLWFITYCMMYFIFKTHRKLLGFIAFCAVEKQKALLGEVHSNPILQLNHRFKVLRVSSWVKSFNETKSDALRKLEKEIDHNGLRFKHQRIPFSCFASGTIGVVAAFGVYGSLIANSTSFWLILLNNYVGVSCVAFPVYWLYYFNEVHDCWGSMFLHEGLFKFLFVAGLIFAYVAATYVTCVNAK